MSDAPKAVSTAEWAVALLAAGADEMEFSFPILSDIWPAKVFVSGKQATVEWEFHGTRYRWYRVPCESVPELNECLAMMGKVNRSWKKLGRTQNRLRFAQARLDEYRPNAFGVKKTPEEQSTFDALAGLRDAARTKEAKALVAFESAHDQLERWVEARAEYISVTEEVEDGSEV